MSKNLLVILLLALMTEDPSEMLARAEALYYEADFAKSVELLLTADKLLQQQTGPLNERIAVKLQLALGLVGLNDSDRAKVYLMELYQLDPEYQIDPQTFAPKVLRLAETAKAEESERHCRSLVNDAQKQLGTGSSEPLALLIGSNQAKCPGLAALGPKVADMAFKEGLEIYKKGQLTEALQKFRAARVLDPGHELAGQYAELTERKLEVTADLALVAWHKDFKNGEFDLAARDYRELTSFGSSPSLDDIRMEYRQALASRVDSWSRACAVDDVPAMDKIRVEVQALLVDPSFGSDILPKLTCAPKPAKPASCIQMDSTSALTRLRNRVEPQFPANLISQIRSLPVTVRVKVRIDVNGSVTISEMLGGDPRLYDPIRTAVDQWKFLPAITADSGVRCVDTELPFVVRPK